MIGKLNGRRHTKEHHTSRERRNLSPRATPRTRLASPPRAYRPSKPFTNLTSHFRPATRRANSTRFAHEIHVADTACHTDPLPAVGLTPVVPNTATAFFSVLMRFIASSFGA